MVETMGWLGVWVTIACGLPVPVGATTEVEEVVAVVGSPDNGAGPFWCYGAPLIVRVEDEVYASVMEVGEGVPPLCNTRWRVLRREDAGWSEVAAAEGFREREPCPIVATRSGRLVLSVNPSTEPPGTQYGRCDPHLIVVGDDGRQEVLRPSWQGTPSFSDHSYRGIAVDRQRDELLVLNIDNRTSEQHWSFGTAKGGFTHQGAIRFPIRSCYPQVALRDHAAHVMAIGDIVEPNPEWAAHKKEVTGSAWDYVFRRLFYTHTPDVTSEAFAPPIEVASVEETGGHITNLDLWLDEDGAAHLLFLTTSTSSVLRDRFFPGEPIAMSLDRVVIAQGAVVERQSLIQGGEGRSETPQYGRFQATPDGRLWVVAAIRVRGEDGLERLENRLIPLGDDAGPPVVLDLKEPLGFFFNATERGGSAPSNVLDLLGIGRDGNVIRYARIRWE